MNNNVAELEQVVQTHRASCPSGLPRGFGTLNPNPHSQLFTSVSVDSSPLSHLFTFATVRVWYDSAYSYYAKA